VPLGFAVLQVLPFRGAVTVVVLMTAVVTAAELRIADGVDPTVIAGPIGIALVTVLVYRALQRESAARQALLDELTDAQHELLQAQHRAGALAERQRLSREIHDSVGQRLASITLLLAATEQDWDRRPDLARDHVGVAAATARDGHAEVRRVVHGLPPVELADDDSGEALPSALQRLVDETAGADGAGADRSGPDVSLHVHGEPVPLAADVAGALLRSARGALANAVEHSGAGRVAVTLTFLSDEVRLDVRDDGRGFDVTTVADTTGAAASDTSRLGRTGRGRGLQGIADRAAGLGGRASVESAPGDGTTVSVELPLETE
jgi:signal transduction histidine kinase